jgi:hypothetical protein
MFSDVRRARCAPTFRVGGRPVDLSRRFHAAWLDLASRGRAPVLAAMARRLCERGEPVTLRLECLDLSGESSVVSEGAHDLCEGRR